MSRENRDKRVSFAGLGERKRGGQEVEECGKGGGKMERSGVGSSQATGKGGMVKMRSVGKGSKAGVKHQTDFNLYSRSATFQLEEAMSRLEMARAYGQSASERNKRKPRGQHKGQSSVRRSQSAAGALCSKSMSGKRGGNGIYSGKCASYFDDSDNDTCVHEWVQSSLGSPDHDPRDPRDTGSSISGQDPHLMSSACISDLLTGGAVSQKKKGKKSVVDEDDEAFEVEDDPNEMNLRQRVEGLRESVAAMRMEAQMLKLQTEEQVLLKEMNALTTFVTNTRRILSSVDNRPKFFGVEDTQSSNIVEEPKFDTQSSEPAIKMQEERSGLETNTAIVGGCENNASGSEHHQELNVKEACTYDICKDEIEGADRSDLDHPFDIENRESVVYFDMETQSSEEVQSRRGLSNFRDVDAVNLRFQEIGDSERRTGMENERIEELHGVLGSVTALENRQEGVVDVHEPNGSTLEPNISSMAFGNGSKHYTHLEFDNDCDGDHKAYKNSRCAPYVGGIDSSLGTQPASAAATAQMLKINDVCASEPVEEPSGHVQHDDIDRFQQEETQDLDAWNEDAEEEQPSLETLSAQMIMQMHEEQVGESYDYMEVSKSPEDIGIVSSTETDQEVSDHTDGLETLKNDELVMAELEGLLEKEVSRGAVVESHSAKSLDTSRTWRLDLDIHDDNTSNMMRDADAEEYFEAPESNRESVSSRELVTRTDEDYIMTLVEEMMGAFIKNPPEFSQVYTSPVPWRIFIELQIARKPNKDQSIFDRCIFETMNEVVSETYRMCNRVGGLNNGEECIPLPPKHKWIFDTKDKILRAVNHRTVHGDAIGAILAQDAWSFHTSTMNIDDEINQMRSQLL